MQNLAVLAALGFASARGVQLVVHDTIGDPFRLRLELWHARKFDSKVRSFIRDLLKCVYCVGFWTSVIAVVVYLTAAGQWGESSVFVHMIEAWCVAGIQMMINRIDDTLPVRG